MSDAVKEVMADEPEGEEESIAWARQRVQQLGLLLIKSDVTYKGVTNTGPRGRPYLAQTKESTFTTRQLPGSFFSAEAAALAIAVHQGKK